ncbi:hypothetical protein [Desulfocurvus vexinensis]|jgi:hypothetical protein|uniref:hypothetical protein n=1 Tax=Desulfocurvus vexinensis TaxID=399548 RepID=UPI00146FA057|nr:hypothetical protein [Desulfocurvus vexinensis]
MTYHTTPPDQRASSGEGISSPPAVFSASVTQAAETARPSPSGDRLWPVGLAISTLLASSSTQATARGMAEAAPAQGIEGMLDLNWLHINLVGPEKLAMH